MSDIVTMGLSQMPDDALRRIVAHEGDILLDGDIYDYERGCG